MKKDTLHIRISAGMKRDLEKIAEKDRRSLTNLVTIILQDWMKEERFNRYKSQDPAQ